MQKDPILWSYVTLTSLSSKVDREYKINNLMVLFEIGTVCSLRNENSNSWDFFLLDFVVSWRTWRSWRRWHHIRTTLRGKNLWPVSVENAIIRLTSTEATNLYTGDDHPSLFYVIFPLPPTSSSVVHKFVDGLVEVSLILTEDVVQYVCLPLALMGLGVFLISMEISTT